MTDTTTTAPATLPAKFGLKFDKEPCSRCGGSGQYSYCSMYGSVCFKCGGSKTQLTRKGAAARKAYIAARAERLSVRVDALVVGDSIWSMGDCDPIAGWTTKTKWRRIADIVDDGQPEIVVYDGRECTRHAVTVTLAGVNCRMGWTRDHMVERYDRAALYQIMQDIAARFSGATFTQDDIIPSTNQKEGTK